MESTWCNSLDILDSVIVNKISFNIDKTLISIATSNGYLIFSIFNFEKITHHSEEEEKIIADSLGNLKIAVIYFQSELLFLVGNEENAGKVSNKELIIWSDKSQRKIAEIKVKDDIKNILIDKNAFFIILENKILVFETLNFEYICTLEDFSIQHANNHLYALTPEIITTNKYSFNISKSIKKTNNTAISYVSSLNSRQLKINKFKFTLGKIQKSQISILINDVKSIQYINSDERGEYIAVVSENGSKIRVYSLKDYECKFHFWRGKADANVLKICFDNENKYMALISDKLTFHFYKLKIREKTLKDYNPNETSCNHFAHHGNSDEECEEDQNIISELFQDMMVNIFTN